MQTKSLESKIMEIEFFFGLKTQHTKIALSIFGDFCAYRRKKKIKRNNNK